MFNAALLGVLYVAAPGPVNLAMVRRGLAGGFGEALSVQVGAFIGDLPFVVMGVLGSRSLATLVPRGTLSCAGASLLLWMGWTSIRSARQPDPDVFHESPRHHLTTFVEGAAIAATNPIAIVFWTSFAGAAPSGDSPVSTVVPAFLLGELACGLAAAALVSSSAGHVGPRLQRTVGLVCGLGLIGFGLSMASPVVA